MRDAHLTGRPCRRTTAAMLQRVLAGSTVLLFAVSCQDGHEKLVGLGGRGLAHVPSFSSGQTPSGATFATDKEDYAPGDTLKLSGAGWQAGDSLDMLLDEDPQNHPPVSWTVGVDESGGFRDSTYVVQESDVGVTFGITATSRATGETATATFTDAQPSSVSLDPITRTVAAGGSAAYTVNVHMVGNTNQCTVTLAVQTGFVPPWTISFNGNPIIATNQDFSRTLTITTTGATPPGTYPFTVQASRGTNCQGSGAGPTTNGTLIVQAANQSPNLANPGNRTVDEGTALNFTLSATDADAGQTLTFSIASGSQTGMTLNATTGAFSWTPNEAQGPGTYPVTFRVTDNGSPPLSDDEAIIITVHEVNVAPLLSGVFDATIPELAPYSFDADASDADIPAQALTFSLVGAPAGAGIDPGTGVFSWTPTEAQGPGNHTFTVRVSDGVVNTDQSLTLHVTEVNGPPVLAHIGDKSVDEETALSFTATASDPDEPANTLTFSLQGAVPNGASIGASSGVLSWTPTEAQGPNSYAFDVCVSDGALSDCETITVTVNEVNGPPVLAHIGDKSVDEETALSFTATATDPDLPANTLTFGLQGTVPSGASIDPSTGAFSWTPTEAQGPGSYTLTVRVTDDGLPARYAEEEITVTVNEVNRAPVLATVGNKSTRWANVLMFTATASDPDLPANALAFSLQGTVPSGASIDPSTGVFTWTPTAGQVGPHSVTIRATDNGSPSLHDDETITITVGARPTILIYNGATSGQYSDRVIVSAVLTDNGGGTLQGGGVSGKTINFGIGADAASAATNAAGQASAYVTLSGAAGSYTVTSAFVGDLAYGPSSDSDPFTVIVENATAIYDPSSPLAVQVASAGGSASFTITVGVAETNPEPNGAPLTMPGNINFADVSLTLLPVGPGPSYSGICTSALAGSGYATKTFMCAFSSVAVNTYAVDVDVTGSYYVGGVESVLTVFDPSLGFVTGGGKFAWPGTNEVTNLGFTIKYNRKGTNPQGSLLIIRHRADGSIYRAKSNALSGLAVNGATATFSGKATYIEPGWSQPTGNNGFVAYVEDNNEPGTAADKVWIQFKDGSGAVILGLSLQTPAADNAKVLTGGNIQVPHQPATP